MSPSEEDVKLNIEVSHSEDKQEEDVEVSGTSSFSSSVVSSSIKNHHKLEPESKELEMCEENGTRQLYHASARGMNRARFLEKSARISEKANGRIQASTRVLDRFQSRHQLPDREILLVSGTLRYRYNM
jgi:hypothetical protein